MKVNEVQKFGSKDSDQARSSELVKIGDGESKNYRVPQDDKRGKTWHKQDGNKPRNRPWINKACTGQQKIKECALRSEEKKKRLLDEHIAKIKSGTSKTKKTEKGSECSLSAKW